MQENLGPAAVRVDSRTLSTTMAVLKARRAPRKRPAQQRSKATVRVIVEAAARILAHDGYARTNVNRVAKLAGVSVGSLYQYFPSKEALVAEVARDLASRTTALFQEGLIELALLPMREAVHGVVVKCNAPWNRESGGCPDPRPE